MKKIEVKLTFTEELLGTASGNQELHADFIASKAPDAKSREEEIAAVGVREEIEKTMTVFPRNMWDEPILFDYQVRGFFKEACGMLRKVEGTASSKLKAFKKEIDGLIFVEPRQIKLEGELGESCQRPLRASTAQGERIALSNSETMKAGTTATFTVICMVDKDVELVKEWLNYGYWHGLGQWRNSGKGRYLWDELNDKGEIIGGNNQAK
jgi:hypothetical protein